MPSSPPAAPEAAPATLVTTPTAAAATLVAVTPSATTMTTPTTTHTEHQTPPIHRFHPGREMDAKRAIVITPQQKAIISKTKSKKRIKKYLRRVQTAGCDFVFADKNYETVLAFGNPWGRQCVAIGMSLQQKPPAPLLPNAAIHKFHECFAEKVNATSCFIVNRTQLPPDSVIVDDGNPLTLNRLPKYSDHVELQNFKKDTVVLIHLVLTPTKNLPLRAVVQWHGILQDTALRACDWMPATEANEAV